MQEFSLGEILQGLREKFSRGVTQKEKIATCLSTVLEYPITIDVISLKGKTVFVAVPPVLKHELYIKKEACLQLLQKENIFVDDIR
jgi:hypothetical protein